MLREWLEYFRLFLFSLIFGSNAVKGEGDRFSKLFVLIYILWTISTRKSDAERGIKIHGDKSTSPKMSDTQITIAGSGNRQVEQESTEETTLSEVSKDLGHTKISEKSAEFKGTSNTSIVEECASKNIQSSCSVVQSQTVQQSVSESRKVTSSSFSSSQSFSSEETEEYVIEG